MVAEGKLDKEAVEALYDNYEKIDESRRIAQEQELESLSSFWACVEKEADKGKCPTVLESVDG